MKVNVTVPNDAVATAGKRFFMGPRVPGSSLRRVPFHDRLQGAWSVLLVVIVLGWCGAAAPVQAKNADLSHQMVNLSESPAATEPGQADEFPEVLTVGDTVHVFWFGRHADGGRRICYRRSLDRGRTWQPVYQFYRQDLTLRDPVATSLDRHMAVVNGTVHLVFGAYGGEGGGWFGQLIYLRSTDNGATFAAPQVLWNAGAVWHAYNVRVASAGGKLAICYQRQPNWYDSLEAHVLISSDNGATFADTIAATGGAGGGWTIDDFIYEGNMVGVLYRQTDYNKGDLHMAVSDDGGGTFRTQRISVLSTDSLHRTQPAHDEHYSPGISCDSGRAHALWMGSDATGANAIFYRRSPDGGRTWDAAQDLTQGTGIAVAQLTRQDTLVTEGNLVFVLIHTSASKLFLRKSVDAGITFGPVVEVTDPIGDSMAGDAWWPVMQRVPSGVAGITALDIVTTGLRRFRSLDAGVTFHTAATGPAFSLRSSGRPQFATDDAGDTHVVCEGSWTWYSTGVFGDADTLYARFNAQPAPSGATAQALQMVTKRNLGDGTGAERFDGMLVPGDDALLPRAALTIECWVKSQPAEANQENYYIEKQGPGAGGAWETLLLGNWRTGQADFRIATETNGYVLVGGASIVDGGWHHLAVSYDSAQAGSNMILYVDGEQAASTAAVGLLKPGRGPFLLGADASQRADGTLVLDDVRIWDHAVGASLIRTRKDQSLSGSESGLVAWFPLDGSTRDASGHGHHGRLLYKETFVTGVASQQPPPAPVITGATILNGIVGEAVSYSIRSSGTAVSFAATGLPAGLNCDPVTGLISGTPTGSGLFTAIIAATGPGVTATLTLTVNLRSPETVIFDNWNIYAVQNGPTEPTVFTLTAATFITYINTYHYFNGGVLPGTIALRHGDGTIYGPWQTQGGTGQGGVLNAFWEAWPMIKLPPGTYTVVDSSPSTWSWNSQSGNRGFSLVRGAGDNADNAALLTAWAANCGLTGADADPDADPDQDTVANWVEAAIGSHPKRSNAASPGLTHTVRNGRHAVSYQACSGGVGVPGSSHVVNGTRIEVNVSNTLQAGSWFASFDFLDAAAAECLPNGDGTETVIIPLRATPGGSLTTPVFAREGFTRVTGP